MEYLNIFYWLSGPSSFIPLGAYEAVIHLSNLIENIFICVLKMNEGLTGLVQHGGE